MGMEFYPKRPLLFVVIYRAFVSFHKHAPACEKGVICTRTGFLVLFFFLPAFLAKPVPFDLHITKQEDNHESSSHNSEIIEIRTIRMVARPTDYAHCHKIN